MRLVVFVSKALYCVTCRYFLVAAPLSRKHHGTCYWSQHWLLLSQLTVLLIQCFGGSVPATARAFLLLLLVWYTAPQHVSRSDRGP